MKVKHVLGKCTVWVVLGMLLLTYCGVSELKKRYPDEIASAIRKTVVANLEANQAEDIEAIIKTMHSQAPEYLSAVQYISSLFKDFEHQDIKLNYELLSFQYIGIDGEYAIARTKQSIKNISGGDFQDSTLDMIIAFRQEKGHWRFWNQLELEIKHYNE